MTAAYFVLISLSLEKILRPDLITVDDIFSVVVVNSVISSAIGALFALPRSWFGAWIGGGTSILACGDVLCIAPPSESAISLPFLFVLIDALVMVVWVFEQTLLTFSIFLSLFLIYCVLF